MRRESDDLEQGFSHIKVQSNADLNLVGVGWAWECAFLMHLPAAYAAAGHPLSSKRMDWHVGRRGQRWSLDSSPVAGCVCGGGAPVRGNFLASELGGKLRHLGRCLIGQ